MGKKKHLKGQLFFFFWIVNLRVKGDYIFNCKLVHRFHFPPFTFMLLGVSWCFFQILFFSQLCFNIDSSCQFWKNGFKTPVSPSLSRLGVHVNPLFSFLFFNLLNLCNFCHLYIRFATAKQVVLCTLVQLSFSLYPPPLLQRNTKPFNQLSHLFLFV